MQKATAALRGDYHPDELDGTSSAITHPARSFTPFASAPTIVRKRPADAHTFPHQKQKHAEQKLLAPAEACACTYQPCR